MISTVSQVHVMLICTVWFDFEFWIKNPLGYQKIPCVLLLIINHSKRASALKALQQSTCFYVMFIIFSRCLPCVNGKSSVNLSAAVEEANSRRAAILITFINFWSIQYADRILKSSNSALGSWLLGAQYIWWKNCWIRVLIAQYFFASQAPRAPSGAIHFNQEDESSLSPLSIACKHATQNFSPLCNWGARALVAWCWDFLAFWICLLLKAKSKF